MTIKTIILCLIFPLISSNVFAGLINFSNWDSSQGSITADGVTYTVTTDDTGTSLLHNFTATGDIDGLGLVNDTLSFTIIDDYFEGSTFTGDATNPGTVTIGGQVDNNVEANGTSALHFGTNTFLGISNGFLQTGNTFELSVANILYTRGEAGASSNVSFEGFSGFNYFIAGGNPEFFVGENGNLTGTSDIGLSNNTNITFAAPVQDFSFTQTGGSATNSRIRVRDLDFIFDVDMTPIPEPSSLLVVSLLLLFGASIRRRRVVS